MPTIGIDLGTTNSLAAYFSEEGPKIIPNILGLNLTPSVVSIDENNEIMVGEAARQRLITHPEWTAACFKRYMGTNKQYNLGKYTFSPEELSSFVLKSLKADAEAFFGEEVHEALISVPAYFNDKQRKATKLAAELAGFHVERLINEPTAAAIAYGLYQKEAETKFMIFDLGGGTFDVSILELFEGIMEVRSIAGDNFLGGEDFTNVLLDGFLQKEKIDKEELNSKELSVLYKQAEICKRMLADNQSGKIEFTFGGTKIENSFSRDDFEKLTEPLLFKLRQPIERAMRDASISSEDLDAVILIGGATRMPIIKSVIGKMFRKLPFCNINPDETVALGAAIQVALKERNQSLEEVILTDVCPYTLGTGVAREIAKNQYESGYYLPIIERNTPIPISRVERLSTIGEGQKSIIIDIYQGESRRVEGNVKLGQMEIHVPKDKAGNQKIDVRYTYDISGILEVEVTIVSTGEVKRIILDQNSGGMSNSEMEQRLEALKAFKIHPRDKMENKFLLVKGERLYEEALGERRSYLGELIQAFERVLERQDEFEIKKAASIFKKQLEEMEGWYNF